METYSNHPKFGTVFEDATLNSVILSCYDLN